MSNEEDRNEAEEHYGKRFDLAVWRRVIGFARPYRVALGLLVVVAITTAAGEAMFTLMTRRVVDDVVAKGMGANFRQHILLFALLCAGFCTCIWSFIMLAGHISTRVAHDVRQAGFKRLQELPFSFYDRRPVGWLVSRMTSDCDRLSRFVAWGCPDLVWGSFMVVGISAVMLVLNWRLALAVMSIVPPMAWCSLFFQKRLLKTSRDVRRRNSAITAVFGEAINGVKTTKVYVREEENLAEFSRLTGKMYEASVLNAVLGAVFMPLIMVISSIGVALALWFGGVDVMKALPGSMTIGTLLAFISYAEQIRMPVRELARVFTDLQSAQAAAERTMDLIDTEPGIRDSAQVLKAIAETREAGVCPGMALDGLEDRIDSLEFRNVSFCYENGEPVLANFSLVVEAGQTVALVGPTGGGKTTIASLACRFYEPTAGEILVNGRDYRSRSLQWLQSNLGVVLQQSYLFSGTVLENIRYGRLDADSEDVRAAAVAVNADAFISRLDDGYDTQVGEGGVMLSTGQKQLVSFARALLADPKILVMDEATSSVDTETEQRIQRGLTRVLQGRISFVIAHRLSTIRSADRILFIQGGRILEEGTHGELMHRRGRYYGLYTEQFVEQEHGHILHVDPESDSGLASKEDALA